MASVTNYGSIRQAIAQRALPHFLVYTFYFGIACLITFPLITQLSTHLAGFAYGDSTEMARHIWWYNHALRTGDSIFWQPNLGYPDGMEGVLLWAHPQQFFPAWLLAFLLPLPAAANLSILFYMALNGWAMYVLARHLFNGKRGPALLAGLVFMAAPTFQGHLGGGHAGLMVMWPVPLYIYALLRLEDEKRFRRIRPYSTADPTSTSLMTASPSPSWKGGRGVRGFMLAVVFFVLSPGGHILQLIYGLLPITAVFLLWQLWRRDWVGLLRTILINVLGGLILLIFVLPIAQSTLETPAYTAEGGYVRYSADLLSSVSPSFRNPLYAGLDYPRRVLGVNLEEGSSYVGLIAGTLAIVGLIFTRHKAQSVGTRWWLLLALVAWLLSLGPLLKIFDTPISLQPDGYASYVTLPWAAVQKLPFFSLARTPGRFNFVLALAVAVLAGSGANWLLSRRPIWQPTLLTVLMVMIAVDYQWYWPFPTIPAEIPTAVYSLAERDDIRAVLDIPWNNPVAAKNGLYLQTAHQQALVAGHVTRSTPVNPAKLTLLERTLDPPLLKSVGADIVIAHKQYVDNLDFAREQLGNPWYEDDVIAIFETPATQDVPQFTTLISNQSAIERHVDSQIYVPAMGWVDLSGTLTADRLDVELYLDQTLIQRWQIDGIQHIHVPVPVEANTFHTVTLALNPPCPAYTDPSLACQTLQVEGLQPGDFIPAQFEPVQFERGVQLSHAQVSVAAQPGASLVVRLDWMLTAALDENDIRFVHLLDASGQPVAQFDAPLGTLPADTRQVDLVMLELPDDLPVGTYRVYVGWYTYPDLTRFAVLSDVDGATDGLAWLGDIVMER